jgi:hypothetical protein
MVGQNPAIKGVIAKIVFLNGLGLNAKTRRWPGAFSLLYFLSVPNGVKLNFTFGGFNYVLAGD